MARPGRLGRPVGLTSGRLGRTRPLPQHWQLARAEVEHEGRRFPLRIWGWSAESAADAAMRARHRLAAAVDQLTRGRAGFDYYPRTPLREEVLHKVRGADGALIGAVTRNRMGVEVLNTDVLLVADVDLPAPQRKLCLLYTSPSPRD